VEVDHGALFAASEGMADILVFEHKLVHHTVSAASFDIGLEEPKDGDEGEKIQWILLPVVA
jgi:hypothetical protein